MEGLPWEGLVNVVKSCPFYRWLWHEFKVFVSGVAKALKWPHVSAKMELTLHRIRIAKGHPLSGTSKNKSEAIART